jgi:hypothetical protein
VRRAAAILALALCPAAAGRAELPGAEVHPEPIGADVRSRRPWVIGAEAGWNALPGAGLVVARRLDPRFTLEAGVGLSAVGAKFGLRARYGFLESEWTPFIGLGFLYGTGLRGQQREGAGGTAFTYRIGESPFLQLVAGAEYQSARGLSFSVAVGYARLLQENLSVSSGSPSEADLSSVRRRTGSGPVASISLGHAF